MRSVWTLTIFYISLIRRVDARRRARCGALGIFIAYRPRVCVCVCVCMCVCVSTHAPDIWLRIRFTIIIIIIIIIMKSYTGPT